MLNVRISYYRRNKIGIGFSYWVTVYPPGKREHKVYEAKKHIYGDRKIRRAYSLKFIITSTIKLRPFFAPSKPNATYSLFSPFFPHFASARSGGRVGCPSLQVGPIPNILPTVYLYVLYVSQDKQRLLLYTELSDEFL